MPSIPYAEIFAAGGLLARHMAGYQPRGSQQEMAEAIAQACDDEGVLVVEAGTGTGKTWAYLVPALLGGGKVLISTGTRTLQDQLFHRDLPRLREALAVPLQAALLKGRGNYVCHYHLSRLAGDERALKFRHEAAQLRNIQIFAQQSASGDRSELASVPEEADIWHRVTSTRENCLGQDCPMVRDCFVMKARRRAQEADLVVVNHALFMADIALREEGVAELLPHARLVVFDEAHQLPDVATRFLGISVSSHQLLDLARTTEAAGLAHAREAARWSDLVRLFEQAVREWRLSAAPIEQLPGRRAACERLGQWPAFEEQLSALDTSLAGLAQALQTVEQVHPDLQAAWRMATSLGERLYKWRQGHMALGGPRAERAIPLAPASDAEALTAVPADTEGSALVRWVEVSTHHVRLQGAPLSVADAFARWRKPGQCWVFTSATLSVKGDFTYFTSRLGLDGAATQRWSSPFDYGRQGLLYVPRLRALPSQAGYVDAFVEALLPLIAASPGGVLVLCTTLRAVESIAKALRDELGSHASAARPVFQQGDMARDALLDQFRRHGRAVLVGSASFWEGIDVPGQALTLVAIDKLPFAPPDDPVVAARARVSRQRGEDPFSLHQLPEAAVVLKQGAGRLIRSERDGGVLVVGDTRLVDKPYGRRLWQGLPPFARTRDEGEAVAFLQAMAAQGGDKVEVTDAPKSTAPDSVEESEG